MVNVSAGDFRDLAFKIALWMLAITTWLAVMGRTTANANEEEPKQLATKGSMLVHVVGPDGEPIAGAKIFANVSFWDRNAIDTKRWVITNNDYVTGADGAVEIKLPAIVADLRVWAKKDGYAPLFAIWWPKQNPDLTALPEEFTYHLQKGTILGGVVQDEEGHPIEGVKVEVRYDGNGIQSGPKTPAIFDTWLSYGNDAIVTDAQGRWKLGNVPPGEKVKVRLMLGHRYYVSDRDWGQLQKEQHVTIESLRAETAVIVMRRGAAATGMVLDPEGKPVKDAVVVWGDHPYWEPGSQEVRTDENGFYKTVTLAPGPLSLTVVAPGWMPQRVTIQNKPDAPATNFSLQPGKKLRIRFVDSAGAPVPRVGVGISAWRGKESLYNTKHPNVLDTKIPGMADEQGVYEWTWAPDDEIKFSLGKIGFAEAEALITANDSEHVITMLPLLHIAGSVVDAATSRPIEQFTAVPMIYFRPDFPSVERNEAVPCTAGKFTLKFERSDGQHGAQIEASGYATQRIGPFAIGAEVPPQQLRLTPADRFIGRVVNEAGEPLAGAEVFAGSFSEHLYLSSFESEDGGRSTNYSVRSDTDGKFEIAHQLERYRLVVVAADGFAMAERAVGALPGVLTVRRWAKIDGRLAQSGKPVDNALVWLEPILERGGDAPRGQFILQVMTAHDGSFHFDRVPPVPCSVLGYLHWSSKRQLSSSRSIPLVPEPEEKIVLALGEGGAEVTGQLVLDPPPAASFDYHFGVNYLVARRPAIASSPSLASQDDDWRKGWSDSRSTDLESRHDSVRARHHFYVKPDPDGRFRISGVEPGEYDFGLRIYAATAGCLVQPVATAVVLVVVKEGESTLDLGIVKVPALASLKVGDAAPQFEFKDLDGHSQRLSDLRGKHVLIDFWATWCGPCVAKIPEVESLRQKYADGLGLIVVGANLDLDSRRATDFIRERKLPWRHALLGEWSSTDTPKQFAISGVPTYVLVGPDGQVLAHEISLDAITKSLDQAVSRAANR